MTKFKKGQTPWNKKPISEKNVIELYKNTTIKEIAKRMDCSEQTINIILNKNNISRRGHSGILHTVSSRKNLLNRKNDIGNLYSNNNSLKDIAKKLNCSKSNLHRVMKDLEIERRDSKIAVKLLDRSGANSPSWLGGKSFEPYTSEFNKELKEKIKEIYNHTCQECKKTEEVLSKDKNNYKKSLRVHHIDYDKNNTNNLNLIPLCIVCHAKTNYNRTHWKNYFQMKVFIKQLFNPNNILAFDNQLNKLVYIGPAK